MSAGRNNLLERIAALSAELRAKQAELRAACARYAADEGDDPPLPPRPPSPPRGRPAKGGPRPGPKAARKAAAKPAPAPARRTPARRAPARASAGGSVRARILDLLDRKGPLPRTAIVAALGCTAGTFSSAVFGLLADGEVTKANGRGAPYALARPKRVPAALAEGTGDEAAATPHERKRRPATARSLLSGGPLGADDDDEPGEGEEDEDDEEAGEAADQVDDDEEDDEDEGGARDKMGRKRPHVLGRYERKPQRFSSDEAGSLHQRIVDHLGKVKAARSDEIAKALGVDTPSVQRGLWCVQRDKRVVKDESTRPALWSLPATQRGAA